MSRIKLHRQIEDNPLWFSEPFTRGQARVDLLLLANHSDGFFYIRGNKIDVPRGCVGRAERTFQERRKWSRTKVRNFLSELQKSKMIIQQKNRLCSIYIIVNFDLYNTTDNTTERPQKNHRKTNTRRKEENNIIITGTTNQEIDESIKKQIKEIIPIEILQENRDKFSTLVELIALGLKTEKTEKAIYSRIVDLEKKLEVNGVYSIDMMGQKLYDRKKARNVSQTCRSWNEAQSKPCGNVLNSFNTFLSNRK